MIRPLTIAALLLGIAPVAFAQDPALQREVACAPRAGIGGAPASAPKIIGAQDTVARTIFGTRDLLIVSGGTTNGLRVGQQFFIRRADVLGARDKTTVHAVNTVGQVSIVAANDATAIALVDSACAGIEIGDYLEPYAAPVLPAGADRADASGELDFSSPGHLLFGEDNHVTVGTGKFVLGDLTEANVRAGARFAVYRDVHQAGVPLAYIGEAVVVFPGPQGSVLRLTLARDAVQTGDLLVPRKP
jgi:hypothetical protein